MAEVKVSQDDLMIGFLDVFRKVGYDGTSLNELAKASGLRKSSLYHRFPEGKQQMAKEVLEYIGHRIRTLVRDVLLEDTDKVSRLKTALKNIDEEYAGGKNSCILRTLSMETGPELFTKLIRQIFGDFTAGFAKLAKDFGYETAECERIAENVLVKVQGSLVVSKVFNDTSPFKHSLIEIEHLFINK